MEFTPLTPISNVETLFREDSCQDPILGPVIRVLRNTNLLNAQDVAAALSVNDRKLSGAVEILTGQSLHRFIFEWRFLQSQQLLLTTDLSYAEVANRCGFGNETVLIDQYKLRLKTTPHIFRTGYRISNPLYSINRHGCSTLLTGENRKAKNKVFSKK